MNHIRVRVVEGLHLQMVDRSSLELRPNCVQVSALTRYTACVHLGLRV